MQMGFNNDVDYKTLTLHIQTEDHGMRSKKITSQVFYSGAILESKTMSYADDIDAIEGTAAQEERIRHLMKALHKKFYQRIHQATYDEHLPLPDEAFASAGSQSSLGEKLVAEKSRGEVLPEKHLVEEFEPAASAELFGEAGLPLLPSDEPAWRGAHDAPGFGALLLEALYA
ncbi:MAG: hypothetical protein ACI81R_000752 [Bradymonadia bacterium]|jgi:hypothetical protein